MTTPTDTDAWCDLIEAALVDDDAAMWADAARLAAGMDPPLDSDEALRQAERLAELVERVRRRHEATRHELDDVGEERRQLLIHARAITSYATSEGGRPIDRLLRMMLVG